jgi:hypothetical protein
VRHLHQNIALPSLTFFVDPYDCRETNRRYHVLNIVPVFHRRRLRAQLTVISSKSTAIHLVALQP